MAQIVGRFSTSDHFERTVRHILKQLSRQRVKKVLQPGNIWVIEYAVTFNDETSAALNTCWLRGWAEPIENAIPAGDVPPAGRLPENLFNRTQPIYRMTDAGWAIIHRSHLWVLVTALIGFLGVCAGLLGGYLVQAYPLHI